MLKSMTGFGRAAAETDGMLWTIEIASVNSRFLDVQARFPRSLAGAAVSGRTSAGMAVVMIQSYPLIRPSATFSFRPQRVLMEKGCVDA